MNNVRRVNLIQIALLGLVLFYTSLIGFKTVYAYLSFNSLFDAAVFNNSFWNTIHGNGLFYNDLEGGSHFRVHFSPTMFLLLPIYWVFPDYSTLLILETLAMAAGIPAVYLIARNTSSRNVSLAFAALYALNPVVRGINLVNCEAFHPVVFSSTLLLYSLYFLRQRKIRWSSLFFVLALLSREDVAIVGIFYGIYIYVFHRQRRMGTAVSVGSLIWFILCIGVIIPAFRGGDYWIATPGLQYLGNTVPEMLLNAVKQPFLVLEQIFKIQKAQYLLALLLPLGFLPLFSPKDLLPSLPQLLINLSSTYPPNFTAKERYTSVILPFLFIGAINGLNYVKKSSFLKGERASALKATTLTLAVPVSITTIFFFSSLSSICPGYIQTQDEVLSSLRHLAQTIPTQYSVSMSNHKGLARFSHRQHVFQLSSGTVDKDVIIVDHARPHISFVPWDEIKEAESIIENDSRYQIVYDYNNLRVFSRRPLSLADKMTLRKYD